MRAASQSYRRSWRERVATRGNTQERTKRAKRVVSYRPVPGRVRINRLPSQAELDAIPHVPVTEFELSERETAKLRRRLYALNKIGRVRYRTLREGGITLVWRIA